MLALSDICLLEEVSMLIAGLCDECEMGKILNYAGEEMEPMADDVPAETS